MIDFTAEIVKAEVVNFIATYKFGCRLNLDVIAETYSILLEAELFPAVRLRSVLSEVTVNIFHTGKCTIIVAKTVDDVQDCIDLLVRNVDRRFFLGL